MIDMKKYFLVALVAMGGVLPAAAFGATLSMSPASGTYQAGNVITAQIRVDTQGAPIEGVDIRYLNYDPAFFEVQDENASVSGVQITPGTLMPNTVANTVNTTLGRIEFSQVISGNTAFIGSGVLATVRFKVLAPGSATVSFNAVQGNTADTNIASGGVDILTSALPAIYTLITPPVQQLAPIVYLSPSSSMRATGTSFPLDIILDTRGTAIDGADVIVTYNRGLVKITDADANKTGVQITSGSLMPNTTVNDVSESSGRITFSQTTSAQGTFIGSGVLVTINARAIAPGAANFTFTFTKGKTNDTNASFGGVDHLDAVTNATIQITENFAAPMITSTEPVGVIVLSRSIVLKTATNEWAACKYSPTPGIQYAAMTRYFSSTDGVVHFATISSGFQVGQNNFYVRCKDKAGNIMNTDAVISFFITTDTAAPFVTQAAPSGVFFTPSGIRISVFPQDQSGVTACKYSLTPYVDYNTMTRYLSLQGTLFSALVRGSDLRNGQNNFYVRCKDTVGNINMADAVISFNLILPPTFIVGIEGDTSNIARHTVSVSLFTPGTTTEVAKVSARPANTTGALVFQTNDMLMQAGIYDVRISSDYYLGRKFASVSIGGGAVIATPALLAGDLNKDGVINSLDWSIMDTQWTKTSSNADINKDGKVNATDWGYLRKNWLQAGN